MQKNWEVIRIPLDLRAGPAKVSDQDKIFIGCAFRDEGRALARIRNPAGAADTAGLPDGMSGVPIAIVPKTGRRLRRPVAKDFEAIAATRA